MKNILHYWLVFCFYLFSLSFTNGQNINQLAREHIAQNKAQYNLTDEDIKEFLHGQNKIREKRGAPRGLMQ